MTASEFYERASASHALERIGLFVVIVIGEAVFLAVTGLAEHPTVAGGAAALFGFIVCAMLARAFFRWGIPTAEAGLVAAQEAKSYGALRDVVMYIPFLLIIGLTFVVASIGISVVEANDPLSRGVRTLLALGVGHPGTRGSRSCRARFVKPLDGSYSGFRGDFTRDIIFCSCTVWLTGQKYTPGCDPTARRRSHA